MRFHGQVVDGDPLDKLLYERYFPTLRGGFFIECGAGNGKYESTCLFFEEELAWKGINIEPFIANFSKLVKNRKNSFLNLNVALSDVAGHADFVSSKAAFNCGSIAGPTPFLQNLGAKLVRSRVVTKTYSEVIAEHDVKAVDLFVLDVEGHELRVIDGMRRSSVWPRVMVIEYGHCGLAAVIHAVQPGYDVDYSDSVNVFCVKRP